MQFSTEDLRRGAFGQPSVPFLLSRVLLIKIKQEIKKSFRQK